MADLALTGWERSSWGNGRQAVINRTEVGGPFGMFVLVYPRVAQPSPCLRE
jgi:hypothetical protein